MVLYSDHKLTLSAKGSVRTSAFSNWNSYSYESYSDFEQWSQRHPGPPYKFGGPWYMTRTWDYGNNISASTNLCQGTLVLGSRSQAFVDLTPIPELSESEETAVGTKLWNAARPNSPEVDLPTALGELYRDGLPSAPGWETWRETTRSAKNAGSEYLNVEFGWRPLVSDVRKFCHAVRNAHKIVEGYRKGGNRGIPRSRSLPPQKDTKPYVGSFVVLPSQANVFATGGGSMSSVEQRVWFKGHFKYYMPAGEDLLSRMYRYHKYANKLLGVRLTPDVLWNLTPWSWAVDWFVDVGTILENVSSMGPDGVAAFDAWLMHSSRKETYSNGVVNSKGISGSLVRVTGWEYKRRRKATPFGFGLSSIQDFTPKQYSIALALGLSHGGMGTLQAR